MQIGKSIDHDFADPPIDGRVAAAAVCGRNAATDNDAPTSLHDEERCADECRIVAIEMRAWCQRIPAVQYREHSVLAPHIVRRWRNRTERGTAQYVLGVAVAQEVREVGVAAGELHDLQGPLGMR